MTLSSLWHWKKRLIHANAPIVLADPIAVLTPADKKFVWKIRYVYIHIFISITAFHTFKEKDKKRE
jgi:hypothetical protein